jgi:antitoxin component of RelBE/YafQ-DinJ toxin-antitoxin module
MPTTEVQVDTTKLGQPSRDRSRSVRITLSEAELRQAHQVADALGLSLRETIRRLLAQAADQLGV